MFIHETRIRVRYADTDQMGFVHHSNYVKYCEIARWEALREIGFPYNDFEKQGYIIRVISMKFDFKKPAFYDNNLTIKTIIKSLPKIKLIFEYEIYNEEYSLISKASTILAFVRKETHKPVIPPEHFINALKNVVEI